MSKKYDNKNIIRLSNDLVLEYSKNIRISELIKYIKLSLEGKEISIMDMCILFNTEPQELSNKLREIRLTSLRMDTNKSYMTYNIGAGCDIICKKENEVVIKLDICNSIREEIELVLNHLELLLKIQARDYMRRTYSKIREDIKRQEEELKLYAELQG